MARLEHLNVTVVHPQKTAKILQDLFGWTIRWQGPAKDDGYTIHIGNADSYLALYAPAHELKGAATRYSLRGAMNHIGVVVEDLAATEDRVKAAGYIPHNHADYEPGQRFYFDGPDGVEYEVVSYG